MQQRFKMNFPITFLKFLKLCNDNYFRIQL